MSKIKLRLILMIISLLIATVLTGCSSSGASGDSDVTQLKFTYWGGPLEKKSMESLIKKFNDDHPKIHAKTQQIQENYVEKMNTMAASNMLPDVGYFTESDLAPWVKNGQLMDQTEMLKTTGDDAKLPSDVFQYKKDGPIAGASVSNEVMNIYYNKKTFDKANISYPPAKAEDAWTWDEFVDIAKKLTVDRNGKHPADPGFDAKNIKTYGVGSLTASYFYESLLYSNGGGIVSPDGKKIILDKPESIQVLQDIADLMYVDHVMPKPSQVSTIPNMDQALLSGRVAMDVDGQWELQELGVAIQKSQLDLGIGVLPKYKKPVTTNEGTPIVIFNTDHVKKNKKQVEEFVKYLMDPTNSLPLIQAGLWMPNEVQWYKDPELVKKWADNPVHPKEYKTAVIDWAMNNTQQNPNYFWADRTTAMDIITPALDQLWNGKKSAKEVIEKDIMPKLKQKLDASYFN